MSALTLSALKRARAEIDAAIAILEAGAMAPDSAHVAAPTASNVRRRRSPEQIEAIRLDYVSTMPAARVAEKHAMTLGSLYMLASQQRWRRPSSTRSYYPKLGADTPSTAPQPAEPAKPLPKAPAPESAPGVFKPHAIGPDLLDAEVQVRGTLTNKGHVVEHLERAVWKVDGITIDRVLFVELGYAVRTGRDLPAQWLAKVAAHGVAA